MFGSLQKIKSCIYQSKKEVKEHLNQDMNGNRKLFLKEVSKVNGGKVENSNRKENGNGKLVI